MIMSEPKKIYAHFLWFKCRACEQKDPAKKPCIKMIPFYINCQLTQVQVTKDFKKDFEKESEKKYGNKCLGNLATNNMKWELITFDEVNELMKHDDTIKHFVEAPVADRFSDLDLQDDDP